jgi:hypothetical protein
MSRLFQAAAPALLLALACTGATAQPPREAKPPADLAAVPRDGFAVATPKVSAAWDLPALKPARDWLAALPEPTRGSVLGVGPADPDRVALFRPVLDEDAGGRGRPAGGRG